MQLHEHQEQGVIILAIEGRLDGGTAPALDEKLKNMLAPGAVRLLLDLAQLDYVSSAGLRCILQAIKKTAASGGKLAACSAQPQVLEILEISGFPGILTLCPDRAAAFREVSS